MRCVRSTYDEHDVVFPADGAEGDGRDLSNHGVEGEGSHGGHGDTLAAGAGIENLGRNWLGTRGSVAVKIRGRRLKVLTDPGKRPARAGEAEVVQPSHDDEAPTSRHVA